MNGKSANQCCPPDDQSVDVVVGRGQDRAVEELAAFAKAIGHPIRVRILRMLARKEARTCSLIVDEFPLAQSTVSDTFGFFAAPAWCKRTKTVLASATASCRRR